MNNIHVSWVQLEVQYFVILGVYSWLKQLKIILTPKVVEHAQGHLRHALDYFTTAHSVQLTLQRSNCSVNLWKLIYIWNVVGAASYQAVHGIWEVHESSIQQQDGDVWQRLMAAASSLIVVIEALNNCITWCIHCSVIFFCCMFVYTH